MNTQTFAHTQAFTAITDDELIAVNGGWLGALTKIARVGPKVAKVGAKGAMIADPLNEMANGWWSYCSLISKVKLQTDETKSPATSGVFYCTVPHLIFTNTYLTPTQQLSNDSQSFKSYWKGRGGNHFLPNTLSQTLTLKQISSTENHNEHSNFRSHSRLHSNHRWRTHRCQWW